ncbi:uncharacterized protein LOC131226640 [Magnolia sinica]|uniref:uncharacterized protein LOC131226640 n=1 Tax=Magnolia sinica TaxID=86752 RepID=UPI002658EB0B|nr:uncharacterized protein LOC131226640 [Magnolia sinica]
MEKYYVVFVGRVPGIYEKWELARAQVEGFSGCRHQSFKSCSTALTEWTRFKATLQNVGSSTNPVTQYRASAIRNEGFTKRVESESASFHRLASSDEDEVGVHLLDQLNSEENQVNTEGGIMYAIFKVLIGVVLIYAVISWFVSSL